MIIKTVPTINKVEDKLSGHPIGKQEYNEALDLLEEEGYSPKSAILKRKAIPPFPLQIPLKIVADWDAQVEDADVIFLLRENGNE